MNIFGPSPLRVPCLTTTAMVRRVVRADLSGLDVAPTRLAVTQHPVCHGQGSSMDLINGSPKLTGLRGWHLNRILKFIT